MINISYNTNGLRHLPREQAIRAVADAGYDGIELSLHPVQFNPFTITDAELAILRQQLDDCGLEVSCLATGADTLLGDERFEPSLISADASGRRRRVELMRRACDIARALRAPVVNFFSGTLPPSLRPVDAWTLLVEGVQQCLEFCDRDVLLALEPEPDFLIQSNAQALALLSMVHDPRLLINQDVGHENVHERHYLESIRVALPRTRHMHVEDIRGRVHHHEIPGEGDIDFRALLGLLVRDNYPFYISVELYHHADVYQHALSRSLAYLRDTEQALM